MSCWWGQPANDSPDGRLRWPRSRQRTGSERAGGVQLAPDNPLQIMVDAALTGQATVERATQSEACPHRARRPAAYAGERARSSVLRASASQRDDPGAVGASSYLAAAGAAERPAVCQGFLATPARPQTWLGSLRPLGESGRHSGGETSPGSTRSKPSKKRRISARERTCIRVETLRL